MTSMDELNDDDRPSNTLELFAELDEVLQMIDNLKDSQNFEKDYEKFTEILSRYQEQPHLLDHHIDTLLLKLLTHIRESSIENPTLMHNCFKYMYIISKVRTFKALVKFIPHELSDLEFALDLLERQDLNNSEQWETRYILLLWMSILVLNPFHMARLDVYQQLDVDGAAGDDPERNHINVKPKMERIFDICVIYSENNDTCSKVAAFLSAKYFVRMDIKDIYLKKFLNCIMEGHNVDTIDVKFGQLGAIAAILKNGKREDLLIYADILLKWIMSCNYKKDSEFLKYKYYIKIIQRIGLVYLKPRIAAWRYKRGVRSLAKNLTELPNDKQNTFGLDETETDDDFDVPEKIEDVIEELLGGLRSASSEIRWSSAKGLGRVTNRLPKLLGDEVVGSVIEIFNPLEANEAWHGACLAIAELAKRGLLLPYRLKTMVPLLMQALFYDEMKGYMSVGQHIRDASCYMCWAFARAYEPNELKPFVNQISAGLLTTAVFDREINCRRAASAAFQESVGRLGNFPHGIDISTMTDFYSVGMRTNSFLEISVFIAQFNEYKYPLIDHLIEKKIGHWDSVIRELSAKALHKLTWKAPEYMANEILPKLFQNTETIDIHLRHGSVLAIGEITLALKLIENENLSNNVKLFSNQINTELYDLMGKFLKRDLFRGMSGEIMKEGCINFILNCSKAKLEAHSECIESWQQILDKCIINKNAQTRENATLALSELCKAYYNVPDGVRDNDNLLILNAYLKGSNNDLEEHLRMGYINAIGALPKFIILLKFNDVITSLIKHSFLPQGALQALLSGNTNAKMEIENSITFNWSEARRASVKALANVVQTIGFLEDETESFGNPEYLNSIFSCYLKALDEYTLDNRGDIGAWVREAAMLALFQLFTNCPQHLIKPEFVHTTMTKLAQQAVEKIDRTRGLAGKLFCNLVHFKPDIPFIVHHEKLKLIFPENSTDVLWLFADHTFPYFCSMLELPEYSQRILLGLSASIGQLTESLIRYSSASLFEFLHSHNNEIPRICNEIVKIFEDNSMNERVTYPMLNFLDILLSSGIVEHILKDENSNFADEIFRLVCVEIKGHKKLYKLASSINVFCQLLQVPKLFIKILSKMAIFLGLTHVHIRKTTATKLYESLALYGSDCGINENTLDEVLNLLSECDWGATFDEVRQLRNKFCELVGIKIPVSAASVRKN